VGAYRLIGYENRILAREDFNDDTKDAGDIGAGHEVTALYEVVPVEVQAKSNEEEIVRLGAVLRKYEELQAVAGPTPDGRLPHEVEVAALRGQIESLTKSQPAPPVDALRFQQQPALKAEAASGELLVVKLRYKTPDAPKEQGTSTLIEFPVKDEPRPFAEMDQDFQLAASLAGFGMLLRDSPYKGSLTWPGLDEMTRGIELLRILREPAVAAEPDPRVEELKRQFPQLFQEARGEYERRIEFRDLVKSAAALSGAQPRQP
jgi:Ca-activated chloride channel family protein